MITVLWAQRFTIYEDPNVASPFDVPELVPLSFEQTWDPTDPLIVR